MYAAVQASQRAELLRSICKSISFTMACICRDRDHVPLTVIFDYGLSHSGTKHAFTGKLDRDRLATKALLGKGREEFLQVVESDMCKLPLECIRTMPVNRPLDTSLALDKTQQAR